MCNPKRWFYKCRDCLSVAACNERLPYGYGNDGKPRYAECGACGGRLDEMGQVNGDRITKRELLCACDERCTSATGPNCECKCGGENHGTGRLVEVIRDLGPIPRLAIVAADKAMSVAAEWKAACERVMTEIDYLNQKKSDTRWLSGDDYNRLYSLQWKMSKARKMKSHKGRMEVISKAFQQQAA